MDDQCGYILLGVILSLNIVSIRHFIFIVSIVIRDYMNKTI
jgi:hypothetical protein